MKRQHLFYGFWSSLALTLLATQPSVAKPAGVTGVQSQPTLSGITVKSLKTKKAHKPTVRLVRTPKASIPSLTIKSHASQLITQSQLLKSSQLLAQVEQNPQKPAPPSQDNSNTNSPNQTSQERSPQQSSPNNANIRTRSTPVPRYLNPNPNPLQFPTKPEEVRILGTQPITFQQALELARRNNRQLQAAQLSVERSRAGLREAQAAEYPRLDLRAGAENTGQFIFGDEPENTFGGNTDYNNIGVNSNLNLAYDLYTSGGRRANIRAAEEQLRFDQLDFERIGQELRLSVATDYYNLQQADEQVRIQRSSVSNALASLRDAQALEQAGVGTRFAVLQSQVQVAQATQRLSNALSQQRISRRQLATRLSLTESVIVTAADPVEIAGLWNLSPEQSIVGAYKNRAELEQQLAQRDASEQRRRSALAQLGPQISLVARYDLNETFEDDQDFRDAYSLGANLTLNLFDGGAARARAAQQEAQIAISETNFAAQRNQIRFEVEQAYSNLQSNLQNIQTASVALEQSREALRLARLRFQAGVGTQTEVIDAEDDLTQAEGDRVAAILDYNRAFAQLQRSISSGPQR